MRLLQKFLKGSGAYGENQIHCESIIDEFLSSEKRRSGDKDRVRDHQGSSRERSRSRERMTSDSRRRDTERIH